MYEAFTDIELIARHRIAERVRDLVRQSEVQGTHTVFERNGRAVGGLVDGQDLLPGHAEVRLGGQEDEPPGGEDEAAGADFPISAFSQMGYLVGKFFTAMTTKTGKQLTREALLEKVLAAAKKDLSIQRYKGLGEMNPEQLWETTMNPDKRTLLEVRIDDAVETDEIFTVLMGDAVEPRRKFIEDNALDVRNLDV